MAHALKEPRSPVTSADRLAFTVVIAVVLHVTIILGVMFEREAPKPDPISEMEVIFIQNPSPEPMEQADYLAQMSQQGSGSTDEKVRPKAPPPSELPSENPEQSETPQLEMIPQARRLQEQPVLLESEQGEELPSSPQNPEQEQPLEGMSAQQLIQRSKEAISLNAELSQSEQIYSSKPREKFITASTKEYTAASYMTAWQQKVEQVGNINYPEAARRENLYGRLIMDVALNADGSIAEIRILRSSGKRVLDDAAIRIVRLAAPFAPFSEKLRQETDILHIIRTWEFERGGTLATR